MTRRWKKVKKKKKNTLQSNRYKTRAIKSIGRERRAMKKKGRKAGEMKRMPSLRTFVIFRPSLLRQFNGHPLLISIIYMVVRARMLTDEKKKERKTQITS